MEIITYKGTGERIDTRLHSQFPYSRSFFHHIIARDGILVNDKKVKKSYKLKNGDSVTIDDLKRYLSSEILSEAPDINVPVVLEKEDYLIINKPKGVLSHPNSIRDIASPSVVGFLYHRFKNLPSVGNFIRAGLLHRLDKDTDGLMIIAKTEKGLSHFKALFQAKSNSLHISEKESVNLHKYYRAVAHITQDAQTFVSEISLPYYIEKVVHAKVPHSIPKLGITKIVGLKHGEHDTLVLELEILTGRTHQIRYHLSSLGLPIVGDYLYGRQEEQSMQLTAYRLVFQDPEGEMVEVDL